MPKERLSFPRTLAIIPLLLMAQAVFLHSNAAPSLSAASDDPGVTGSAVVPPALDPQIFSNPESFLGFGIADLVKSFGPPITVKALRGLENWQDDVVFSYPQGVSFFIYDNRVWQIRLNAPFSSRFLGLALGDSKVQVTQTLGEPWEQSDNSMLYRMPYTAYPVRLKLYFDTDVLVDAYIYRADF